MTEWLHTSMHVLIEPEMIDNHRATVNMVINQVHSVKGVAAVWESEKDSRHPTWPLPDGKHSEGQETRLGRVLALARRWEGADAISSDFAAELLQVMKCED